MSVFRNKFSGDIFNYKYRHDGCETWEQLAKTVTHDVCFGLVSHTTQSAIEEMIAKMQFIPGGRYLYYAGRPYKAFNNCFDGNTNILTDKGWRKASELGAANVVSPIDGNSYTATFKSHGIQELYAFNFIPVRGSSKVTYTVKATRNHKWRLNDGTATEHLVVGQTVPASRVDLSDENHIGFVHGFVFGDGNRNGQLRLCADKDKAFLDILAQHGSVTYPPSANGDPVLYFSQKLDWKHLPTETDPVYIASFIRGWLAADGCGGHILCSVNKPALEWFRAHAAYAGLTITGALRAQVRNVQLGTYTYPNHEIFIQNYSENWAGFKLASIEPLGLAEVFCPFEPVHNQIIIDHNIHTYQCYLLRAEEDTREDWANLSWKAESCLSTGGGIGVDYSVYRAKGSALSRTGGQASGPVSKMRMINEIGREVMQGGSRRSAIYASLNWQHPDVHEFITAKDWHHQVVPGTDKTLWDVKQFDFNFPAPLDMTNVSLNYDDAWLNTQNRAGHPTFRQNCFQALSTGEPGFSFNFGTKQKETLRNACTEVTSEDDSDVCNLGSLNLSRISTLADFKDCIELATIFLLCGTLRAHLPYTKVEQIRDKNRRLGLGLMGLHEWLIQRNTRYEVSPELHEWLAAYSTISRRTADLWSQILNLSRPVACRAIAPTGTIGILAGTTTGIEPVFAVAYKRRYLKNGTDWHYQYVIDSAAKTLIDLYGTNPDNIESALDLANDYERRIKFQADVQDYVDMAISSTINLPAWGTALNGLHSVERFAETLSRYAPRLRGFTVYPDGARGGQPLTRVAYKDALEHEGTEFKEHDICQIGGKGGVCGV